jgi:N-carbamoylputrescine amidase
LKAKCALIQMGFSTDRDDNVRRAAGFVHQAAAEGAEIICLPELATSIYMCFEENPESRGLAEPIPGPATEEIGAVAREAGVYVVFPLYEREADGLLYNTASFIDRSGEVVGKYRKNSIPDVRMAHMSGMEKYYFRPGNLGYPVFETDLGITVGVTICFERHFPEGPRIEALAGADVIFVPTATAAGREMWEIELRGHAVANLLWVGGVNRVGRDSGTSNEAEFYGDSFFSSPSGEIVAQAGEGEEIVHAEIDTDLSRRLRRDWGFFRDRRPEIFTAVTAA